MAGALEGKTIVVTGAAQGLGAAIARHLHGLGALLILLDRDEEGLDATGSACPATKPAMAGTSSRCRKGQP